MGDQDYGQDAGNLRREFYRNAGRAPTGGEELPKKQK